MLFNARKGLYADNLGSIQFACARLLNVWIQKIASLDETASLLADLDLRCSHMP